MSFESVFLNKAQKAASVVVAVVFVSFFSLGRAECFLQTISFMANLEICATAVKMKQCPLDQVVSCIEVP